MSSPKDRQNLQPLQGEVVNTDSSAQETITLSTPSPGCEDRSANNANQASGNLKMRTCSPGELSAKMDTETSVGALNSTIQKKAAEMKKGPSEASPVTTTSTSTTTLTVETVHGRQPLQTSGELILDHAEKQNLSRTREQCGRTHEVSSTTASAVVRASSDSSSLVGEHIKGTSKDSALQQCSTTSSQESIKKEPVFLETGPLSSFCPVTQIDKCSKNRQVDETQLRSIDPQVSLATDVKSKRDQSADVQEGTVTLVQGISKYSLDSATTSGSGTFILGACKSASDPPGGSDALEIASKQKTNLIEITVMCSQEEKHSRSHPCPSTMHSDLSQGTTYDRVTTSANNASREEVEDKDPGGLSKSSSPLMNYPQHNVGTQHGARVEYKSVAISPIVPPGGSSSFTFHVHAGKRAPSSPKGSPKGPPGKKVARTVDTISKTGSFELVPPLQEVGTQAGIRADCKSVANSPIVPPDGSSSFSFQTDEANMRSLTAKQQIVSKEPRTGDSLTKTCSFELTPPHQDVSTQADTRAECKSVAVSPFIFPVESSSFPFQEIKEKHESTSLKSSSCEHHTRSKAMRTLDTFPKTSSFKLVPPQQDFGSQADTRVECKSVAISPIVFPSDGSSSFTFQGEKDTQTSLPSLSCKDQVKGLKIRTMDTPSKTCSIELAPPQQIIGTQADTRVECKTVTVSPIILPDGDSSFSFQENKVGQSSIFSKGTTKEQTNAEGTRTVETFTKTYSFELTPPQEDEGTPSGIRAECKSVAVSPIIPLDGSSSFSFYTDKGSQRSPSQKGFLKGQTGAAKTMAEETFSKMHSSGVILLQQDDSTHIDKRVEYKSVAVSPIIVYDGSTAFTFQAEKKKQESSSPEKLLNKEPAMDMEIRTGDALSKTCLFELTAEQQDVGTEADTRVECKSVAVSPIIPSDGSSSFTFGKENQHSSQKNSSKQATPIDTLSNTSSIEVAPPQQDVGTQADTRVECKSAAVSPIVLPGETSSFPFSTDGILPGPSPQKKSSADQFRERDSRNMDTLSKGISFEITPPQQDVGVQVDTLVHCVHVAVSPIIPPDGSTSFTFQSVLGDQGPPSISAKPGQILSMRDAEMQVYISVETRSVATGPMTPLGKSPRTSYPEVRVKGAKEEQSEPVREVSWDEKGMTWEVYGASMEVEVLGMAIQKHLEKQIEEHGRQKVMTPQNTRSSSIRGAPATGDAKRPPSIFRALLHNMRRPRCCSRSGPAAE